MKEWYYQIKGQKGEGESDGFGNWSWPPIFSGKVDAEDKKQAKQLIEEEYGRTFPLRVLQADLDKHAFLLNLRAIDPDDDRTRGLFELKHCQECQIKFRVIDKWNDSVPGDTSQDFCCRKCRDISAEREKLNFQLVDQGKHPAVIYSIRQISTGKVYVGQTTQAYTLRWWQHLSTRSGCRFHTALMSSPITDWQYQVLEVISAPAGKEPRAYIDSRERFWIDEFDSVATGFNTVLPSGESPQGELEGLTEPARDCETTF